MGLWASVAEQLRAEPRLSSSPAAAMLDREVVQCSPHLRQWRLRITPSTQFRTVLFYVHSSQHFHFLMIGPTRHIYSIPTSFSSSSLSRVIALSASKAARGGASGGGCGRGRPRPSPILLPHPPTLPPPPLPPRRTTAAAAAADNDNDNVDYAAEMEADAAGNGSARSAAAAYAARAVVYDGVDPFEGMEFDNEEPLTRTSWCRHSRSHRGWTRRR